MLNATLSHSERRLAAPKLIAGAVLVTWFAVVLLFGTRGAFVSPPGTPPIPLLIAVVLPLIVYFAAFHASGAFREFVLSIDLRFMAGIQAWRFAGLGFLALYVHGILPGAFALPAGLGDMAIGTVAPWIVASLGRDPGFVRSSAFRLWNWLGVLDLVIAVGVGAALSALAGGVAGEVTTSPMAQLPLVLIPTYLVPIFVMLHFSALGQARTAS